jgi:mannose-6-phosphate isomerase-like protein (cupin superfamily)
MPERPRPALEGVRDMLRARDDAQPEPEAQPTPRPGDDSAEVRDDVATARLDLDGDERFQTLRRELGVSTFGLNLLRLRPGQRGRIHRHERQEEVYLVLEGTLTLTVEGDREHTLERGDLARVAPQLRRQLTNRGTAPLAVLAIGGAEPHEGRDGVAFEAWDDEEGRAPQEVPLPPDLPG